MNLDLDTRLLSEFVYALNIARRQVAAYPPGHPMIASAVQKLLVLVEKLLEFRRELTIGIARNTLLIDDKQLDPGNPVYRDLADNLFNARVASLTVRSGATADEVRLFFEILAYSSERIDAAGGLSALLISSGVQGFMAQQIDFRAFHATEVDSISSPKISGVNEDSAVLWKAFAGAMVSGTIDPHGVRQLPSEQLDPLLLAEVLNREEVTGKDRDGVSYEYAIADFIRKSSSRQVDSGSRQALFDRLGILIEQLSPELRRRMLNSTLQGLSAAPDQARNMLSNWSQNTLVEALEQADINQLQIPQVLLDIIGKLGDQKGTSQSHRREAAGPARSLEQTAGLLNKLFCDGDIESFVPKNYADALRVLAAADVVTSLEQSQVEELLESLNGHTLERQFCAITLDLMQQNVEENSVDAITCNLEELIPYFLASGDFPSLTGIHEQLLTLRETPHPSFFTSIHKALDIFAGRNFTAQVLDGLDEWGKDQYPTIREMIGRIGVPFIDPLLDRLAEEPLMARRRLYMECLQGIGAQATGFIVGRLNDPRWYVVRNLVVLLRESNDPQVLRPLNRLTAHPHPKVRYEVTRTFLYFNDPQADHCLLHELKHDDTDFLKGIVRLAGHSRNPEVAVRLTEILNARGNSDSEMALKGAIISSLAEMNCVQALPGLGDFIENRSLFMQKSVLRLKIAAVNALERHASPEAAALAVRLRQKSSGEISMALEKVCQRLSGVLP